MPANCNFGKVYGVSCVFVWEKSQRVREKEMKKLGIFFEKFVWEKYPENIWQKLKK